MAVAIDTTTVYEPDALVRCAPVVPPDAVKRPTQCRGGVLTPSTRARITGNKLIDYFPAAVGTHYLIILTEDRAIIHHARNPDGTDPDTEACATGCFARSTGLA